MRGEIIKYNRAMPVDVLQLSVTDKLPQSGLTASQPPQGGGLSGSLQGAFSHQKAPSLRELAREA